MTATQMGAEGMEGVLTIILTLTGGLQDLNPWEGGSAECGRGFQPTLGGPYGV